MGQDFSTGGDSAAGDELLQVVQELSRLIVRCDAAGQQMAGNHLSMAIDILRAAPDLCAASVFREAEAHLRASGWAEMDDDPRPT